MNTDNTEIKTSSRFLHQSKLVRRRVENRVRKLLGRREANICSQGVPLPITSEGQTPIKVISTNLGSDILACVCVCMLGAGGMHMYAYVCSIADSFRKEEPSLKHVLYFLHIFIPGNTLPVTL